MLVVPAHRGLDDAMQFLEAGHGWQLDSPPDWRFGVVEHDLQADDGVGRAHAGNLSALAFQFQGNNSPIRFAG